MSKFYSGQDGQLFVNDVINGISVIDPPSSAVAKVRSWSFTINTSVLETVSLSDHDRTIIPGITSTTGSASIYYYAESTSSGHNSGLLSSVILKAILPRIGDSGTLPQSQERQKVKFRLQVDSKHYIDIVGVITSFSMTNSVGEVMAADVSFEADGIPTESLY